MNKETFNVYYFTKTPIPRDYIAEVQNYHDQLNLKLANEQNIHKYYRTLPVNVYSKLSNSEKVKLCTGTITDQFDTWIKELIAFYNPINYADNVRWSSYPTDIELEQMPDGNYKYQMYGINPIEFDEFRSPSGRVHVENDISSAAFLDGFIEVVWNSNFAPVTTNDYAWRMEEDTVSVISNVSDSLRLTSAEYCNLIRDLSEVETGDGNEVLRRLAIVYETNLRGYYSNVYTQPYVIVSSEDMFAWSDLSDQYRQKNVTNVSQFMKHFTRQQEHQTTPVCPPSETKKVDVPVPQLIELPEDRTNNEIPMVFAGGSGTDDINSTTQQFGTFPTNMGGFTTAGFGGLINDGFGGNNFGDNNFGGTGFGGGNENTLPGFSSADFNA